MLRQNYYRCCTILILFIFFFIATAVLVKAWVWLDVGGVVGVAVEQCEGLSSPLGESMAYLEEFPAVNKYKFSHYWASKHNLTKLLWW